jgi:hypothetical protein
MDTSAFGDMKLRVGGVVSSCTFFTETLSILTQPSTPVSKSIFT